MIECGVKKGIEASEKEMSIVAAKYEEAVASEQELRLQAEHEAAKLRIERDEACENHLLVTNKLQTNEQSCQPGSRNR